jgi:hypothetical protein
VAEVLAEIQWGFDALLLQYALTVDADTALEATLDAEMNAAAVLTGEEYYRKLCDAEAGPIDTWGIRDQHMVTCVMRILDLMPARACVWAHNSHGMCIIGPGIPATPRHLRSIVGWGFLAVGDATAVTRRGEWSLGQVCSQTTSWRAVQYMH